MVLLDAHPNNREIYVLYLDQIAFEKELFSSKGQTWFGTSGTFYAASFNLIEFELDGGKMIKYGIADAEFCQGSILSLLLTADFVSIQQKLSSLFTMESDCPERIGQMEHFPSLTTKQEWNN